MVGVDYETRVRKLWAVFERDGIDGLRGFVDDDVEWTPANGAGTIRGFDALAEYVRSTAPTRSIVAHAWEQHGDCVLVHGSMRTFDRSGFVDTQPSWVYFFRDGRLRRTVAFATREEALAAIAAHNGGA